jgi:hypothetical protein
MTAMKSELTISQDDWDKIRLVLTGRLRLADMLAVLDLDPGTDFTDINLRGTSFRGCNLAGFDFSDTDLTGADLCGADLRYALGLDRAIVANVKTDEGTRWPSSANAVSGAISPRVATNDAGHVASAAPAADDPTAFDLRSICDRRKFTGEQRKILVRNVTGQLPPNPDRFLWVLANVLAAAFLGRARRDKTFSPFEYALEIVLAEPSGWRQVLTQHCDGIVLTSKGLAVEAGELTFRASSAMIEHALAFGEFLVMASDYALGHSFGEAVNALYEAPASAASVRDAVRILSSQMRQWRLRHLPLSRHARQYSELYAYLEGRPEFDGDDIIGYWRKCLDGGDRMMFETAVRHFRIYDHYWPKLAEMQNFDKPADSDTLDGVADAGVFDDVEFDDSDCEDSLLRRLKSLPAAPGMLSGTERKLIARLAALQPLHRRHPVTILRLFAFGTVQLGISNRLRRGAGGADIAARVTCSNAVSYDRIAVRFDRLLGRLDRLLRIALALRIGNLETLQTEDTKLVERLIQQGNADLTDLRLAGFDGPRDSLAAIFARHEDTLTELRDLVRDFTKALERMSPEALRDRFAKDRHIFSEILTRAYVTSVQ